VPDAERLAVEAEDDGDRTAVWVGSVFGAFDSPAGGRAGEHETTRSMTTETTKHRAGDAEFLRLVFIPIFSKDRHTDWIVHAVYGGVHPAGVRELLTDGTVTLVPVITAGIRYAPKSEA
jgi:hypothetical protein